MKILKNPNVAIFFASLLLFTSCNQYDFDNEKIGFDYSIYDNLKNERFQIEIPSDINKIKSELEKRKAIINLINTTYNSELKIPEDLLIVKINDDYLKINKLYSQYLSQKDIELMARFELDLLNNNFDVALTSFEKNVLNIHNLTNEEFQKYNNFANIIRLIENEHNLSYTSSKQRSASTFKCFLAIGLHFLATTGLVVCQPGSLSSWPCIRAILSWASSIIAIDLACHK